MLSQHRWIRSPEFLGIVLLALPCLSAPASDNCACAPAGRGTYVGLFGGGGISSVNDVNQIGTALFPTNRGGALRVNATGDSDTSEFGLVGLQLGHEWSSACGRLLPAVEFEGFYLAGTHRANVSDPTNRLRGHVFATTFPMDSAVFLTNLTLSANSPCRKLIPYVGGGIGAAGTSITGADSAQIVPPEPGVNHYNSDQDTSSWSFAAQAKAGLRYVLSERAYAFAEYRFLYIGSSTVDFGQTVYPTHIPTTPWIAQFGDKYSHLGVVGVGLNF